ncbi:MAG: oligosaccharide flippase family protein, partial [Bacteroidales bacterium]
SSINTLLLWYFAKWIPLLQFSVVSFKDLFSFGSKLLLSGIIDTVYRNIYTIVIGKKFSAQSLGYYTRADQFAQFPSSNITGILGRVTYPVLSSIQHDDDRLRQVYRKYLRLSAFVIFPLMVGLAAVAKPTIQLLLSDEWLPVVPLLQALCFSMMWYPIHAINLNLLQVKGRSDLFLRLEIIKKVIGIAILSVTIPLGILAMCIGLIFSSIICLAINTHYTGKLIQVGFVCQMKDLLPTLFTSLLMGAGVWLFISFITNQFISLVLGIILGIFIYFLLNYLTKSKELSEIRNFR